CARSDDYDAWFAYW
nr:immunoglobulin heavy chain junction region [Mus musculus]